MTSPFFPHRYLLGIAGLLPNEISYLLDEAEQCGRRINMPGGLVLMWSTCTPQGCVRRLNLWLIYGNILGRRCIELNSFILLKYSGVLKRMCHKSMKSRNQYNLQYPKNSYILHSLRIDVKQSKLTACHRLSNWSHAKTKKIA
jgi:hypothetical protein